MDVSGQIHAPATLPLGVTRYPLNGQLGGPQSRAGQSGEESPQFDIMTHKSCPLFPIYSVVTGTSTGTIQYQPHRTFLENIDVLGQASIMAATYSTV